MPTITPETSTNRYADSALWFDTGKAIDTTLCDVFYVLETVTNAWTDAAGEVHYLADDSQADQRAAMRTYSQRAYTLFGDSTNFFSPYYRQLTIEPWLTGFAAVDSLFPTAMADVQQAFDYYMTHWNGGRRFVLAGFSQGGKAVKELIQTMPDKQYRRMVAAYLIGFPVTADDVARTDRFIPAQGATDKGVTISFNSVANEAGIGAVFSQSEMIINPVSWSTSSNIARLNDSVTVSIDAMHKVLLVIGINPETVFVPSLQAICPKGNYHLLEMDLYQETIRENVKQRIYY